MTKHLLSAAVLAALPMLANAAPPAPEWTVTGNLSVTSDYRFRGISQTNKKPALQGGFDVQHSSGWYIGNWNSNVDSELYSGSNLEMDVYTGYRFPIAGITFDVGALHYAYPGSGQWGRSIHNTEVYAGAAWQGLSLKYSYAVSDFFSAPDSNGSAYTDLSYAYDFGRGWGANAHIGRQSLKGGAKVVELGSYDLRSSITDYKLGVTYDYKSWVTGVSWIDTNRDLTGGTAAFRDRNISNGTVVVSLTKSF